MPIRESVESLGEVVANPRRDIIASSGDDIGAKGRNQPLVFLGGIGDDRQALGFGKLDEVAPIGPRPAGRSKDLACRQL
jgi:hypothetical protein